MLSWKRALPAAFCFPPDTTPNLVVQLRSDGFVNLQEFLMFKCPSLFMDFRSIWWLFNGHLQTLYGVSTNFRKQYKMWYKRTFLSLSDGGTLGIDFSPIDDSTLAEDTPIIVVQHGLTGGSHESYLRMILAPACTPVKEGGLGYRAAVVNFRGCAGVPLTTPKLYTAGHTHDLRQAVVYLTHKYPRAQLLGLGFSLGANVMTRYIAEEGSNCRLSSALVFSCPWNMEKNGYILESSFLGKNIWARGMGRNLQRLVKLHQEALTRDPHRPVAKVVPRALSLPYPTMSQFDHVFTAQIGDAYPPFPFSSVAEYYRWCSSDHSVADIRIPFLAINAADDPVVGVCPMDGKENPYVALVLTHTGGHLGWFLSSTERWTTQPALEWLEAMGNDVVAQKRVTQRLYVDEEGYMREEGSSLGCKEMDTKELIDGNLGNLNLRVLRSRAW